jgi:hypothetical protein
MQLCTVASASKLNSPYNASQTAVCTELTGQAYDDELQSAIDMFLDGMPTLSVLVHVHVHHSCG